MLIALFESRVKEQSASIFALETALAETKAECAAAVSDCDELQQVIDKLKARAEAAESALTTARIDGAREFAEWCDCQEPSWNVQSVNGDFIASFGEALARWLASESKEG